MDEQEIHKLISQAIVSSIPSHLTNGVSKLSQLQQFYKQKRQTFTKQISSAGRSLTKKIFATGVKCIRHDNDKPNPLNQPNLISLAFIVLKIAFQDEYVMRLTIQQINSSLEFLAKMLKIWNPFKSIDIGAEHLQKIFAEIILKINNRRASVKLCEILRDYQVGSFIFSIFLRTILIKLGYNQAENLKQQIDSTQEIYSILCDYFDLNIIAHRAATLRKNNKIKFIGEEQIGNRAQIYLFTNYNVFISTPDNQQFCFGKYYSNETQLLNSDEELRKSTLDYLMKCKQANQKQKNDEEQQNQDKFLAIRMSGYDMDLGMSTSVIGGQGQTPYFSNFSNSNADTPEFGNLLDSMRFRKSMDFQTAIKLVDNGGNQNNFFNNNNSFNGFSNHVNNNKTSIISNNPRNQFDLGIVEEELCSPVSDGDKLFMMKQSYTHFFQEESKPQQSNFHKNKEVATVKITTISNHKNKSQNKSEEQDIHNKPRSPPSVQRKQKHVTLQRAWDSSRQLTFQQNKYFITILRQERQKQRQIQKQNQQKEKQKQKEKEKQNTQQNISNSNKIEMRLKIPEIGKKSVIDNSDMKSQSKAQNFQCQRQFKQFVNLSVKQSQHFLKVEENMEVLSSSKRRQLASRKYSAHQAFTNQLKQLKLRQKNVVHYSNHFANSPQQQQSHTQVIISNNAEDRKKPDNYWNKMQIQAIEPSSPKNKKMGFSSNIVNLQFGNKQNNNGQKQKSREGENEKKSKSADRDKRKLNMSKKFQQFKQRMAALRNSKSSRGGPVSPRRPNQLSSTVGLSRHTSQKYHPTSQNKPSNFIKKANKEEKAKQSLLTSTLKLKQKQQVKDTEYKSSRKNSKFPEFLRNCKRKTNTEQDKNKLFTNSIGYSKEISNTQSKYTNCDVNLKQTSIKMQDKVKGPGKKLLSSNEIRRPVYRDTVQKQKIKYVKANNLQSSQINTLQKQQEHALYQTEAQKLSPNESQASNFNKNKHTKSQPQLFPAPMPQIQNIPNKNILMHDLQFKQYNQRPWQYFGKTITKSSLCLQYNREHDGNHETDVVRFSCPNSNNIFQRTYSQNKNFNRNEPLVVPQTNAFINFGGQRATLIKNPENSVFQTYQIPSTQNLLPNYGASPIKIQYLPNQRPWHQPQPSYVQQPKLQIRNVQQVQREKMKTAVSSNVFSTKADSPPFLYLNTDSQSTFRDHKQYLMSGVGGRKTQ